MDRTVKKTAEAGENGRDAATGRFVGGAKPGPGRPKGTPNQATIDVRALRTRMLATFDEPDADGESSGMVALRQLRDEDPRSYLRLVISLLPADASQVEPVDEQHAPITTTPKQALAALEKSAGSHYDPLCGLGSDAASCTAGSA